MFEPAHYDAQIEKKLFTSPNEQQDKVSHLVACGKLSYGAWRKHVRVWGASSAWCQQIGETHDIFRRRVRY